MCLPSIIRPIFTLYMPCIWAQSEYEYDGVRKVLSNYLGTSFSSPPQGAVLTHVAVETAELEFLSFSSFFCGAEISISKGQS